MKDDSVNEAKDLAQIKELRAKIQAPFTLTSEPLDEWGCFRLRSLAQPRNGTFGDAEHVEETHRIWLECSPDIVDYLLKEIDGLKQHVRDLNSDLEGTIKDCNEHHVLGGGQ